MGTSKSNLKDQIIATLAATAIVSTIAIFFTFEGRISKLESNIVNLPSIKEMKQFKVDYMSNALSQFPTGAVMAISKKETNIPKGWSICNGVNGVPDLSNTFLMGVSNKNEVGNTGGENAIANAGNHSHSGSTSTAISPAHNIHCSGKCAPRTGDHNHSFQTKENGQHSHGDNRPAFYSVLLICKLK